MRLFHGPAGPFMSSTSRPSIIKEKKKFTTVHLTEIVRKVKRSPIPLDSVVWYGVYTCSERSDRDGYPLDWTGGAQSWSRGGNGAVLRARGLAGGTAAPGLWLPAVLGAGGQASPLY